MNTFPCYSNNASIPLWLIIDKVLEVVNRQTGVNIMVSEGGMPWGLDVTTTILQPGATVLPQRVK